MDNLKAGVVKPDLYDPQHNRTYAELAAHYGCLIDPGRVAHPKDKPRVERPMRYGRDSFWAGRAWPSLAIMNTEARRWCEQVAGTRRHGTTGRQPREQFQTEEQTHLLPLPPRPWEFAVWTTAKVGPDSRCQVDRVLYSVPWRYLHRRLEVRLTRDPVEFFWQGACVKVHRRGHVGGPPMVDPDDYPPDKLAYSRATPTHCRERAAAMGAHVATVVEALLAEQTAAHLRPVLALLRLAATYGNARWDAACHRAWVFGDPRYRTVRTILEKAWDQQPLPPDAAPASPPAGGLLRGPAQFTTSPRPPR